MSSAVYPKSYITLNEFALKLGLSRDTVERLIARKIVRAIQLRDRGRILIPVDEIARLAREYQR